MKLRYEWYANSTNPADRSGTAVFHVPGHEPDRMWFECEEDAARVALMLDWAHDSGQRDERRAWTEMLQQLAAQRGREE